MNIFLIVVNIIFQAVSEGEMSSVLILAFIVWTVSLKTSHVKTQANRLFWAFFGHRGLRIVSWYARAELS